MSESLEQSMEALQPWIGSVRLIEDDLSLPMVRRVASTFDIDPDSFTEGAELPPHWFTVFFADIAMQHQLRQDGHPEGGVVLPPIPMPRRMGAGRRMTIMSRLRAGEKAVRKSEVVDIVPKTGRSGNLYVLTLRNTYEQGGRVAAIDELDAIYREATPPGQRTTATVPVLAPTDQDWTETAQLSETLVFRYSALTWNAHRIHYDLDYSRNVEGYPHTVQNGSLTTHLMINAALRHTSDELRGLTVRLTSPLFVGDQASIRGYAARDGKMRVFVADKNGTLCGEMELEFA